jgi:hypothetical protein
MKMVNHLLSLSICPYIDAITLQNTYKIHTKLKRRRKIHTKLKRRRENLLILASMKQVRTL